MLGAFTIATTVVLACSLLARADVEPDVPGPGVVYKAGSTCHIEWNGDAASNTIWKDMAIELMTGDNFNMVHLTTVATGQDGTVSGQFDHICPEVTINAPIYFYQFSSPHTQVKTWATRFTIASSTGSTVPAPNANQPGTNEPIPWGTGALSDPSKAVPAPNFVNGGGSTAVNATSATPSAVSSPSLPPASTLSSAGGLSSGTSLAPASVTSSSGLSTVSKTASTSPSTTSAGAGNQNNGALAAASYRPWTVVVVLGVSAAGFTALF